VLPLAELGGDFYDELKSRSSGYASFDYEDAGDRWVDLAKSYLQALPHRYPDQAPIWS